MGVRYCVEIADGPSADYTFAYFDSDDHLADFLFRHEQVDVRIEGEFGADGEDPFRIILCSFPRDQRERFLATVEMIPGLMDYAGRKGYDAFCREFLLGAARYLEQNGGGGITRPQ